MNATPEPVPEFDLTDPREFVLVSIDSLAIDPKTQRTIDPDKVEKIANEFDWARFEAPTVTRRGKEYIVIEGQHRVDALRRVAEKMGVSVDVMVAVVPKSGRQYESGLGFSIARGRIPHSSIQQWHARVRSGNRHAVVATEVLERHALRLGAHASTQTIGCPSKVWEIITARPNANNPADGAALLDRILFIVERAYPDVDEENAKLRWDGRLFTAIWRLLQTYPDLNDERLRGALRSRIAEQWINQAASAAPGWLAIFDGLKALYNKSGQKGRLL